MLLTFEQAKNKILSSCLLKNKPESEEVKLADALDRIVAQDIISPINVPHFNNSAMDGYAVRLIDLTLSDTLPIAGEIFAGDAISDLIWPKGSCLRIMTGAPVPNDADAVVMQENTTQLRNKIKFQSKISLGDNIRLVGEDIKAQSVIVPKGIKLSVSILSSLSTLGISRVNVFKKLSVAIFSTGNELTAIGNDLLREGAIYDTNRFTLQLLLTKLNCEVYDLGIIPDDPKQIKDALAEASAKAHLIITSGGVSVGDADYTKQVLEELGSINFWKIAIKPGKPFAFGNIAHSFFCGLPGNPVSALVTFYQLVQPLILTLSGCLPTINKTSHYRVKTSSFLKKTKGRLDFQRGILKVNQNGILEVSSSGLQGSHITQSFSQANCFIVLEQDRGNVEIGEWVTVEPFNSLLC